MVTKSNQPHSNGWIWRKTNSTILYLCLRSLPFFPLNSNLLNKPSSFSTVVCVHPSIKSIVLRQRIRSIVLGEVTMRPFVNDQALPLPLPSYFYSSHCEEKYQFQSLSILLLTVLIFLEVCKNVDIGYLQTKFIEVLVMYAAIL